MTATIAAHPQSPFPRTRYQGSKRRYADAIVANLASIPFGTVLDAFGGTGAVAHAFKRTGKRVTYNDVLAFNHQIGLALIENDSVRLSDDEVESVGRRRPGVDYPDFIERTFDGIYFTRDENRWLDTAATNIRTIPCRFKRALAWHALFQSALAKRPYNLFHRRNLYMRTADVKRSFGNKASWDRPFADHFRAFAAEANHAVIDGRGSCRAICNDALNVETGFDLVYIDTPYISRSGVGVDYRSFYHFLEGLCRYDDWPAMIDLRSRHRALRRRPQPWSNPAQFASAFDNLCSRFRKSILAVSYRNDGIPTLEQLAGILRSHRYDVRVVQFPTRNFALSPNRQSCEVLLIAEPV